MRQPIRLSLSEQDESALSPLSMPHPPVHALYVHIPFCFHKCHYCDFYSLVDRKGRDEAFLEALLLELAALARHVHDVREGDVRADRRLRTIFIGGGTPTLLPPALWRRLLDELQRLFDCSWINDGDGEFTVECNPETSTPELMQILAGGGVDRISVGAQSFNTAHLKALERWHDPDKVALALQHAADAGIRRRSVDLIYAIPGQTLEDWRLDLEMAMALAPGVEHISCYELTYETNTPMTRRLNRGDFTPACEELQIEMQRLALERLAQAGMTRYEVSNYASSRSDGSLAMSQHNLVYWRGGQWLAAGPSASGHLHAGAGARPTSGVRWKNVPRLTQWMEGVRRSGGYSPVVDVEPPSARRSLQERIMMGLRLTEGVHARAMLEDAEAIGAAPQLQREVNRQCDLGRLTDDNHRWRLTDEGFFFADGVAADLMSALQSASGEGDPTGATPASGSR